MCLPFASTLRALERDARGGSAWTLALAALALLAALGGWLEIEIPITADSVSAFFGVVGAASGPWVLRAPESGIIASRRMALGQRVRRGEPLVVLEAGDLLARRAAVSARRTALLAAARALGEQQAAAELALAEDRRAQAAARAERGEHHRQAAVAAELAGEVRSRQARLEAAGLLAPIEAVRGRSDAEQKARAAAASALAAEAGTRQGRAALADRRGAIGRLAAELARLQGEFAGLEEESTAVEARMTRRILRSPAAGRLGSVAPDPAGSHVIGGALLATLVPDQPLRVAARFSAAAGGAIRRGQRAWISFPAGPTMASAVLPATVAAVAPASAGSGYRGGWEVELELRPGLPAAIADAESGQPCQVEVVLARQTPAAALRRALFRTQLAPP